MLGLLQTFLLPGFRYAMGRRLRTFGVSTAEIAKDRHSVGTTLRLSAGQTTTTIFATHADQRGVSSCAGHKYLLFSCLLPHVGLCRVQRAFLILRSLLGLPSVFTRST